MSRKQHNLEEIQAIAQSKGGKCLSKKYCNTKTKLEFCCARGHTWRITAHSILAGRWCLQCSRIPGTSNGPSGKSVADHPRLVKEWHPSNVFVPDEVAAAGLRKVMWSCSRGHAYDATPYSRVNGAGCPFCCGRRACKDNCLDAVLPELTKEWHPTKNGSLTSKDVTRCSGKNIWWRCKYGHEWLARVYNRSNGTRCPACVAHGTSSWELRLFCELSTLLGRANVKHRHIIHGCEVDVLVSFGCREFAIEIDGYRWHHNKWRKDSRKSRHLLNAGVKVVRLRQAPLKKLHPDDVVISESEMGTFSMVGMVAERILRLYPRLPSGIRSKLKLYLERQRLVADTRYRKRLLQLHLAPSERSFAKRFPAMAREWHVGNPISSGGIYAFSNKKALWICPIGHEYKSSPANRAAGSGCPYCVGHAVCWDNCLAAVFSSLAAEWHPTKNGKLTSRCVTAGSTKSVWWLCSRSHVWKAKVANRAGRHKKTGCPFCATLGGSPCAEKCLASDYPAIAIEWHREKNGDLTPDSVRPKSSKRVWWMCDKGHEWQQVVYYRVRRLSGCQMCESAKRALTEEAIMKSARQHKSQTGKWPTQSSGEVDSTTWKAIEHALRSGSRGLRGGSSLRLLFDRLGRR